MSTSAASAIHTPAARDGASAEWVEPFDRETQRADRELGALAEALASLLARDGDDPPAWTSPPFVRRISAARSIIASVDDPARLATGLEQTSRSRVRPSAAHQTRVRRLAGDAMAIAIVLRWRELRDRCALPGWPEIVRRRSLDPPATDPSHGVGHWFG